ncbi:hypothetical protein HYH02_014297 [Chlamydomonas schloesseri]|uniref:Uncharacterized protein n=1 Tax=Chlamydomonas schloesseri TaxID=2026947 RepID=A0A835SXF8_9CHLO|nr:hypothetical protein HYH02_014297 [Chlamydomonas schloesseri]|eukprot:KAG2428595.1 hypothetical protein HYH02_014297 [Chlamydomonas schloesseri]
MQPSHLALIVLIACSHAGAQAQDTPGSFSSSVKAIGPRLVYTAVRDNCTSVAVFNRSDGQLIWRTTDTAHHWAGTPGQRHVYSTALQGHSLQAAALGSGKPRWAFPSGSKWIPDWIHRRDSLGLAAGTVFVAPQEAEAAGSADGGGGGGDADYDLAVDADVGSSSGEGDAVVLNRLPTLTALSAVTAARSSRLLLRARTRALHEEAVASAVAEVGSAAAPPAPGSAPAAGSLVLVSTQDPGSHLYAVAEDTGRLAWQLSLEGNPDLPGANITALLLPPELPALALISVAAVGDPAGGSGAAPGAAFGSIVAVELANGSVRWATGALPGGAPSVVLVTAGAVVLRGRADADLTQTLYGLRAATGALVWTKACSNGCTVLPVDDKMAVIASYGFSVSELEGVELATGKVLWRGVDSSTSTGLSCSGASVAHKHLFFGCTCEEEVAEAEEQEQEQEQEEVVEAVGKEAGKQGTGRTVSPVRAAAAAVLVTTAGGAGPSAARSRVRSSSGDAAAGRALGATGSATAAAQLPAAAVAAAAATSSATRTTTTTTTTRTTTAAAADGGRSQPLRRGGVKAAPLCAYAVSTDTGEAAWSSRLGGGDNSSFPVASGAVGLLPLVVEDTVVIATAGWVHALERTGGKALWNFELPLGQQLQSWDTLDEWGGVVVVRTSGVPPEDSRLLGLGLLSGELVLSSPLPPAYAPGGSPSHPYDLREGVVYVDACSGSHCCVVGLDLRQQPPAPPPPASASAASLGRAGSGQGVSWLAAALHRRLQAALLGAESAAAAQAEEQAEVSGSGKGKGPVEPSGGGSDGGGGGGSGGGGGGGGPRSFQYCFDVEQACRASRARSVGGDIVYALLFTQVAVLLVGFGSVVIWRACYRRRYAPYTRLNALPVLEQYQHDVASEEADDDSEDGVGTGGRGAGGGGDEGGDNGGHSGHGGHRGHRHGRRQLIVDPDTGIAVPVVVVEQQQGAAGAAGAAGAEANGGCTAQASVAQGGGGVPRVR